MIGVMDTVAQVAAVVPRPAGVVCPPLPRSPPPPLPNPLTAV